MADHPSRGVLLAVDQVVSLEEGRGVFPTGLQIVGTGRIEALLAVIFSAGHLGVLVVIGQADRLVAVGETGHLAMVVVLLAMVVDLLVVHLAMAVLIHRADRQLPPPTVLVIGRAGMSLGCINSFFGNL